MSLLSAVALLLCSSVSILQVAGALAPRQSAAAIDYYRPPWQCPTFSSDYTLHEISYSIAPYGDYFACTYYIGGNVGENCNWHLSTGAFYSGSTMCPTSAPVNPPAQCEYECPSQIGGLALMSSNTFTSPAQMGCLYVNGPACTYDISSGALLTAYSGATCPAQIALDCGQAIPDRRRYYRSEDNYTAWLVRRAKRESNPPPAPVPGPGPLLQRGW
ncbi:hypothetical protein B0H11DRAFT_2200074 [Mycena galericulata]|nr:hypothetical protein B0H11DRAFT_2200074 [Mycena galericulata]